MYGPDGLKTWGRLTFVVFVARTVLSWHNQYIKVSILTCMSSPHINHCSKAPPHTLDQTLNIKLGYRTPLSMQSSFQFGKILCSGFNALTFQPKMSQKCSIGFRLGLWPGHAIVETAFWRKNSITARDLWRRALPSMNNGLVRRGLLSKWGSTALSSTSVW